MELTRATSTHDDSLPLELLELAGWQLRVHNGATVGTRATRADAELAVNTPCFAVAAGTIFAEAMRSSRHQEEGARTMAEFDRNDSESRRLDDDLTVVHGRTETLLALGCPLRDTAYLALSDVDLHEIERLIGKGRPAETAVRMAG